MGRTGQALYLVCEPRARDQNRCRQAEGDARPEAARATGSRHRPLPRERGTVQPVLRRDHPTGDLELA